MKGFVRISENVNNTGDLISVEEYNDEKTLNSILKKSPKGDWYTSLFTFGPEAQDYFNKHKSIKGYEGTAYSRNLVFDLDSKDDLNLAKDEARALLNTLKELGVDVKKNVRLYFSGNKGFHIIVGTNQSYSHEELKVICCSIAKNLTTFDTAIYNRTRLFRIANTRHLASGLFKIELDPASLKSLTIEAIKELAKAPVNLNRTVESCTVDFKEKFIKEKPTLSVVKSVIVDDVEEIDGIRGLSGIDFHKCPKDRPKCIHALMQGVMVPNRGHRNHVFLHLGNYLRNQGYNKEAVTGHLNGIAKANSELYPEADAFSKEEIKSSIISRVFSNDRHNISGWGVNKDDEIFRNYCKSLPFDRACPLHDEVKKDNKLVKIDDVFNDFSNFAENFTDNIVPTGIKFIDEYMKICVGTTTLLAGACGSGKTSLALNIMENVNNAGMHTVFFSLDMHKNLIYLKLAQKLTTYKQDEILDIFKKKDHSKIAEIKQTIKDHYCNTYFDFTGTLSMDDMKDRVIAIEQRDGVKIKLVVIDYAGRITSNFNDSFANAKHNALRSKDVAMDTDAAWLILNQVGRNTGDGSNPLRTKRVAKDSGDWEDSATNIITIWRPFLGQEGQNLDLKLENTVEQISLVDDVVRLYLAKNRMGSEIEEVLHWNGAKGSIVDMSDEEKHFYKQEREYLEKEVYKIKRGF
jgi:KaiC/GvpD/RAD55 family RecA-like ATPase